MNACKNSHLNPDADPVLRQICNELQMPEPLNLSGYLCQSAIHATSITPRAAARPMEAKVMPQENTV